MILGRPHIFLLYPRSSVGDSLSKFILSVFKSYVLMYINKHIYGTIKKWVYRKCIMAHNGAAVEPHFGSEYCIDDKIFINILLHMLVWDS